MKLEELEALEKGATPGPWLRVAYTKSDQGFVMMLTGGKDSYEAEQNARFVAASRAYMPKLIAVAEAAQTLLSSCCEGNRDLHGMLELEDALKKLEEI